MDIGKRLRWGALRSDPGGYRYEPSLLEMGPHRRIWLVGHWQNEQYFAGIRERLLAEFRLKPEYSALGSHLGRDIAGSESVAVHIRRGDNIVKNDPKTGRPVPQLGMVSKDYVTAAMRTVRDRHPDAKFFIFSDEVDWVRAHMGLPADDAVYVPAEGFTFELMARCRHQVIANSTFSWWAAWLNGNPDKTVIAPKLWDVRKPDYDTSGLLPSSWLRL
jgi:hypothetical protein